MTLVHRHMIESKHAFGLVAECDGRIVGYMTASSDCKAFSREFVRRHGLMAAVTAFPRLFLPTNIEVVLKGLFHFRHQRADDPNAEIIAGAVLAEYQGSGIYRRLSDRALSILKERGCTRAMLSTVDPNNSRARQFYDRYGWVPVRDQAFYRDTVVSVYHLDLTTWQPR